MASAGWPSAWRPNSSRLLTTPSLLAPMSTRISSLSIRTTLPSTTSPCLKLLMSRVLLGEQLLHRRRLGPSGARGDAGSSSVFAGGRAHPRLVGAQAIASSAAAGGLVGRGSSAARSPRRPRLPRRSRRATGGSSRGSRSAASLGPLRVGRSARRWRPRRRLIGGRGGVGGDLVRRGRRRLGVGLGVGGGGLVGDGDRRDGVLGRLVGSEALASGSGAVPPCCSSVNGLVTPGGGFAPGIRTARASLRAVGPIRSEWSVGDLGRGPLLRASAGV